MGSAEVCDRLTGFGNGRITPNHSFKFNKVRMLSPVLRMVIPSEDSFKFCGFALQR
jgi:hypothetical protein